MQQHIREMLQQVLDDMTISDVVPHVVMNQSHEHGEYSSNLPLVLSKIVTKNPLEIGEEIAKELRMKNEEVRMIERVEVAKPGFLNFFITREALEAKIKNASEDKLFDLTEKKKIMVEFAHPNTHKAFHIGHLRNITTGEAIVRLLESTGNEVIRANYQGDVGMHIAKTIHGLTMLIGEGRVDLKDKNIKNSRNDQEKVLNIIKDLTPNNQEELKMRIMLLGDAYAYGNELFEKDDINTTSIKQINKCIYTNDWGILAPYQEVYKITRQWSLDYFNVIYKRVYTHFDRFYFESEVYENGKKKVLEGLDKGIFEESQGAIIFPGSKHRLHDRVFISNEGNPTYEGKEMGLGPLQFKEYNPDLIIHVVGPEQAGYFQVVFEALAQLFPETKGREKHLAYGWVKLKHGKMSSRTGNVVLGEGLLDEAKKRILEQNEIANDIAEEIAIAAVKYSFLKVGLGQEIAFDMNESISFEGNSGPYLQYAYVRAKRIIEKLPMSNDSTSLKLRGTSQLSISAKNYVFNSEEFALLRQLGFFADVVQQAAAQFAPHVLATYLFQLAQVFNQFYEKVPVFKGEESKQGMRLFLVKSTAETIKKGLHILGIGIPEKM